MTQKHLYAYILLLSSSNILKAMGETNLYDAMRYNQIFNQQAVFSQPQFTAVLQDEALINLISKNPHAILPSKAEKIGLYSLLRKRVSSLCGKKQRNTADAIKKYSSKDLDDELIKLFRKNKHTSMQQTLYKPLFATAMDMAIFGGVPRLFDVGDTARSLTNFILIKVLSTNASDLSNACYKFYISPESDPLDQYEQLYATKKRFFSESLQRKIEDRFGAARKSPMALQAAQDFLRVALNLPVKGRIKDSDIVAGKDIGAIELYLKESLKQLDDTTLEEQLFYPLFHHILRSAHPSNSRNTPKAVIYMSGKPGVGKTYTAGKIADIVKSSLIKAKVTSSNAADLIGSPQNPGQLLSALTNNGKTANDDVILVDEIDRIVNTEDKNRPVNKDILTTLLPLFEPTEESIASPFLGAEIDISHYLLVLVGNSQLQDEALKNRVTANIIFKEMTKERKENIVFNSMLPEVCQNGVSEFALDPATFTQAEKTRVQKLIDEDTDPGLRTIKNKLTELVNNIRIERFHK